MTKTQFYIIVIFNFISLLVSGFGFGFVYAKQDFTQTRTMVIIPDECALQMFETPMDSN